MLTLTGRPLSCEACHIHSSSISHRDIDPNTRGQTQTYVGPRDGQGEVPNVTIFDVDGQSELVERFLLELEVLEPDVSSPQRDREIFRAETFDVTLKISVQDRSQHRFEPAKSGHASQLQLPDPRCLQEPPPS